MQIGDLSNLIGAGEYVTQFLIDFFPIILLGWLFMGGITLLDYLGFKIKFTIGSDKKIKTEVEIIEELKSYCKGCGKEIKPINKACNDCIAFAKLILS